MKRVGVSISDELHAEVVKVCKANGWSLMQVGEMAFQAWGAAIYFTAKKNLSTLENVTPKPGKENMKDFEELLSNQKKQMELYRWFGEKDEAAQAKAEEEGYKAYEERKAKRGGNK